jgi:hypothetical protein
MTFEPISRIWGYGYMRMSLRTAKLVHLVYKSYISGAPQESNGISLNLTPLRWVTTARGPRLDQEPPPEPAPGRRRR